MGGHGSSSGRKTSGGAAQPASTAQQASSGGGNSRYNELQNRANVARANLDHANKHAFDTEANLKGENRRLA